MGDDRVGGHVWKFVSAGLYQPGRLESRALLSEGTLYCARFNEDGTGQWRPILMDTTLDPAPDPGDLAPPCPPEPSASETCTRAWRGAADAYRAANAVGGSPSGRPKTSRCTRRTQRVHRLHRLRRPPRLWPNRHGEVGRLEDRGWRPARAHLPMVAFFRGRPAATPTATGLHPARNLVRPPGRPSGSRRTSQGSTPTRASLRRLQESAACSAFPSPDPTAVGPRSSPAAVRGGGHRAGLRPVENALFLSVHHPGGASARAFSNSAAPRGSNWPSRRLGTARRSRPSSPCAAADAPSRSGRPHRLPRLPRRRLEHPRAAANTPSPPAEGAPRAPRRSRLKDAPAAGSSSTDGMGGTCARRGSGEGQRLVARHRRGGHPAGGDLPPRVPRPLPLPPRRGHARRAQSRFRLPAGRRAGRRPLRLAGASRPARAGPVPAARGHAVGPHLRDGDLPRGARRYEADLSDLRKRRTPRSGRSSPRASVFLGRRWRSRSAGQDGADRAALISWVERAAGDRRGVLRALPLPRALVILIRAGGAPWASGPPWATAVARS